MKFPRQKNTIQELNQANILQKYFAQIHRTITKVGERFISALELLEGNATG